MPTQPDAPWTTESFLAWEDRQEFKHAFDGQHFLPVPAGTLARQDIMIRPRSVLDRVPAGSRFPASHAMRPRIGARVRYPDVVVRAGPPWQPPRKPAATTRRLARAHP